MMDNYLNTSALAIALTADLERNHRVLEYHKYSIFPNLRDAVYTNTFRKNFLVSGMESIGVKTIGQLYMGGNTFGNIVQGLEEAEEKSIKKMTTSYKALATSLRKYEQSVVNNSATLTEQINDTRKKVLDLVSDKDEEKVKYATSLSLPYPKSFVAIVETTTKILKGLIKPDFKSYLLSDGEATGKDLFEATFTPEAVKMLDSLNVKVTDSGKPRWEGLNDMKEFTVRDGHISDWINTVDWVGSFTSKIDFTPNYEAITKLVKVLNEITPEEIEAHPHLEERSNLLISVVQILSNIELAIKVYLFSTLKEIRVALVHQNREIDNYTYTNEIW